MHVVEKPRVNGKNTADSIGACPYLAQTLGKINKIHLHADKREGH